MIQAVTNPCWRKTLPLPVGLVGSSGDAAFMSHCPCRMGFSVIQLPVSHLFSVTPVLTGSLGSTWVDSLCWSVVPYLEWIGIGVLGKMAQRESQT